MKIDAPIQNPLCGSYRKPWIRKTVNSRRNPQKQTVTISLSPVLYHGTARFIIEDWKKNGINNRFLSLTSNPVYAAGYAQYNIKTDSLDMKQMELENKARRQIKIGYGGFDQPHLPEEFKLLKRGKIVNSLALFDRDAVLAVKGYDYGDDESGGGRAGLHLSENQEYAHSHGSPSIPFEALMATFNFIAAEGNKNKITFWFHVFNQLLWDENFSQAPPFKGITITGPSYGSRPLLFVMNVFWKNPPQKTE